MGVYEELGIRPFVNAADHYTRFGGSIMWPCAVEAMVEASRQYVNLFEMQTRVGEAIAEMTGNEAACVSCGAAGGIALAVAACMAGKDPDRIEQLPDTTGMKNEVIVHRCARFYEDIAIQVPGATIVEMGDERGATEAELAACINERTAAVLTLSPWGRMLPIDRIVHIAHGHGVPVLVDAAFSIPPKANFRYFTHELGVDAIIASGGKAIRGPQTTGLVIGKKFLVEACAAHGNPNRAIGRTMKVGKEELAGIYAAVKYIMERDEDAVRREINRMGLDIRKGLSPSSLVKSVKRSGDVVSIDIDLARPGWSDQEIERLLLDGDPSIVTWCRNGRCRVKLGTLQPGEVDRVIRRLRELLCD